MRLLIYGTHLIFLILFFSCKTSYAQKEYNESLENHRIHYTVAPDKPIVENGTKVVPRRSQQVEIDSTLKILAYEYGLYKDSKGFRILIYSGTQEEEALAAQNKLRKMKNNAFGDTTSVFETVPIDLSYQSPNFKVLVRDYIGKLLPYQMLLQLREEFPKALLIPLKDVKLENID